MNVVIFEDNIFIANQISNYITSKGYSIIGKASTFQEAKSIIQIERFDLAIIDIHLDKPDDGLFLAEEVGKLNIPYFFLTGQTDQETIRKISKLNPINYIVKPFHNNQIQAALLLADNEVKRLNESQIFTFYEGKKEYREFLNNILYIQSDKQYSHICFKHNIKKMYRISIHEFQNLLQEKGFIRVNRFSLINSNYITVKSKTEYKINDLVFRVSKKYMTNV